MLGIVQKGADYLIRLPVNAFKEVELFEKSNEMEAIVTLHPTLFGFRNRGDAFKGSVG
ncbi:MAG: Tnp 1 protein [Candidatus Brocadiaceae bacterium]|jgi:uncharacterized protein involved in propanediol utilization|nr:Tnp 1 protein [Candidatus Brocadiaceae bacterium]